MLTSKQKDFAVVDAPPIDDRTLPDLSSYIIPAELLNDKIPTQISNGKLPARTELVLDAPEPAVLKRTPKVTNEDPFPWKRHREVSSILGRKISMQSLASEYEEVSITKSDSFSESDYVIKTEPSLSSDQCSDENVDNGVQDEWWESSPGFIEVADDQECMFGYGRNDEDHEKLFMDCCYRDQKAYGVRSLQEKRMHEPFYYSDDGDRGANYILSQKRKLLNGGLNFGGRNGVDLREHLTKRRFCDGHLKMHAERFPFKRCNVPLQSKERWVRPQRRVSTHRFHGRLELKLEINSFYSLPMKKSAFFASKQRHQSWNSQLINKPRHHHRQKRKNFASNVQRTTFSRRIENTVSFTGPMTLVRIKAEKSRT